MAQLKSTTVSGSLRVTDTIYTGTAQFQVVRAPTASNGTTYGPGTDGQVLKSNGISVYWASDTNSDVNVTQAAAITTAGAYPIILANSTATTAVTGSVNKTSTLTYNPNTKALVTGGTVNGYTLAAASAKEVDTTIAAATTSTNLPTSAAVRAFVEGKGYDNLIAIQSTQPTSASTKLWINEDEMANTVQIPTVQEMQTAINSLNITYSFQNGTNQFIVTPPNGSPQTVTITPYIANNITGSGTSGYLAKFNGANTITNGPALGSSTTTFLRNDGQWATATANTGTVTNITAGTGLTGGTISTSGTLGVNLRFGSSSIYSTYGNAYANNYEEKYVSLNSDGYLAVPIPRTQVYSYTTDVISSLPQTYTDSRIDASWYAFRIEATAPEMIVGDLTVTTSSGEFTINGTLNSTLTFPSTEITVYFIKRVFDLTGPTPS